MKYIIYEWLQNCADEIIPITNTLYMCELNTTLYITPCVSVMEETPYTQFCSVHFISSGSIGCCLMSNRHSLDYFHKHMTELQSL